MRQMIEMPVWVLLVGLAVAFLVAWANAWIAMRFVRRNGMLLAPPAELIEREQQRRALTSIRGGDGVLPADFDGRVVE